jgi:ketosteroid isomerase-like protein
MADSELTESTRALVHELYASFRRGDLDAVGAAFADDIEWHIEGPNEVFSFCGPRKGRDAAMAALRALVETYEHLSHDARFILVDGHRACLFAPTEVRHRTMGSVVSVDLCDVMEFTDGKITWFREVFDTLSVSEAVVRQN